MAANYASSVLSEQQHATIFTLPDEIWTIILCDKNLTCKDILNFGETCKLYNEMVKENQIIWKVKLKTKFPHRKALVSFANCKGDWLAEVRDYYTLKSDVFKELMNLCSKFYKQDTFMTLKDVEVFFNLASSKNVNYYIVISVLCEVLKTGNQLVQGTLPAPRPYNLTDMYFAKIVLRYLIHAYLMIEWVKDFKLDLLTPENVIHFFHQWIDTANIHLIDDCYEKLDSLTSKVEAHLDPNHPFRTTDRVQRDLWLNGTLPNNAWNRSDSMMVLAAVKIVLFEKHSKDGLPLHTEDAFDIVKAIDTNVDRPTIEAALFSCLCRRFGVRCDLITFSDHMFLEWREDYDDPNTEIFNVNLNGELEKKRRCPFSQGNRSSNYRYCPDNLLTHLYGTFIRSMGAVKNWNTENVYCLYEFLRTNHAPDDQGPYKNFMLYLMGLGEAEVNTPLCLWNMDSKHLDVISILVNMHRNREMTFKVIPKPHNSQVKFAVGMVCFHMKYEYLCVIKGWDTECSASTEWQQRMAINTLEFGAEQPYYQVVVADYSERYVAQENLCEMTSPCRLNHLEDVLAPEFSYFDGFAYIPNEMKLLQYPTDGPIREMYKNKRAQPPS